MKRTLLVTAAALALSLAALPAMAQSYYERYDAPITGSQLTDLPSMSYNTIHTGSFLSEGPRYAYDERDAAYYRDRGYDRDRDYYRDRDYHDGHYDGY